MGRRKDAKEQLDKAAEAWRKDVSSEPYTKGPSEAELKRIAADLQRRNKKGED